MYNSFMNYLQLLSQYGQPKRWFTKIYVAFLSGAMYILFMYQATVAVPFGDVHLYRRENIIEKYESVNKYTTAYMLYKELSKTMIETSDNLAINIQKNAELYDRLINLVKKHTLKHHSVKKMNKANKAMIIGKGYILKNNFAYANENSITEHNKIISAYSYKKINNFRFTTWPSISGIIIKLKDNTYVVNKFNDVNITQEFAARFENNQITTFHSNDFANQKTIEEYVQNNIYSKYDNIDYVIIANKLVFGDHSGMYDDEFYLNKNAIINNYKYTGAKSVNINNSELNEKIIQNFNEEERIISMVDIAYNINNGTLKIDDILEMFEVINVNYEINKSDVIDIQQNRAFLVNHGYFGKVMIISDNLGFEFQKETINTDELFNLWLESNKNNFLNYESQKMMEIR